MKILQKELDLRKYVIEILKTKQATDYVGALGEDPNFLVTDGL